jgi:membrane protease YdiL (CAAX protease family)
MIHAAHSLSAPGSFALARDAQFVAALAFGPVVWLAAMALTGQHHSPLAMLAEPLRYASLVIAWPLLEEWLFRGLLQPAFARAAWGTRAVGGISVANLLTSGLFATAHLFSHAPSWALAMLVPSLAFGYFRDRHNSMLPSAVLHVFYNAGWFMLVSA